MLTPSALSLAAATQPFAQAAARIRTHTLSNGLQLLVWPDHNIPHVALYQYVRAGSRNEGSGTSGLAHFFEHMMFNGTASHPQGEFDRLLEAQGGSNNAYTSQDLTVYQDWFPRAALPLVFELESDRFSNLAFIPEVVENERQVVSSERRLRVDDSNPALLDEQVQASAFLAHPYRIPIIGWPSDIQSWTLSDLQQFYRSYYAPNNRTLVLAGDVEPDAVFALAQRYFEPAAARAAPPAVRTREPEQRGERRLELSLPATNPLLQIAYHAISAADARAPTLNLLQSILVGGEASRLNRALVEQQAVAVAVGGGWPEGFDPSVFCIHATLSAQGSLSECEAAVDAQLARLLQEGVSERELQRGKNLIAADFWRALATIDGKARLLGEFALMHGDYRLLFDAPERYQCVNREQVAQVARDIFNPQRRTVGVLRPLPRHPDATDSNQSDSDQDELLQAAAAAEPA